MSVREILKMGDPRLLRIAKPVDRFDTAELDALIAGKLAKGPAQDVAAADRSTGRADWKRALRYSALDHAGNRLGIRNLANEVRRPQPTIATTIFSPAQLRLVPGSYHWYVRTVVAGVEDRLPDRAPAVGVNRRVPRRR